MGGLNPVQLRSIDDRAALAYIALDYAIVFGLAAAAIALRIPLVTAAAIIIIAGRQAALMNLMHAASHYSLFARKSDNDSFDFLYAFPILDSVRLYRPSHLEHHRDIILRSPDRFNFLHGELRLPSLGAWGRTWVVFIRPLLGHSAYSFIKESAAAFVKTPKVGWRVIAYWSALILAFAAAGWLRYFLLFWVLPLLWLYPVLTLWAEVSDHFAAAADVRNQRGAFYEIFLKSHEKYHWVHHHYPYVPFYRLASLHRTLTESGVVADESSGLLDFLRVVYAPAVSEDVTILGCQEAHRPTA